MVDQSDVKTYLTASTNAPISGVAGMRSESIVSLSRRLANLADADFDEEEGGEEVAGYNHQSVL